MSSFKHLAFALVLSLSVSGCGFTPMYAGGTAGEKISADYQGVEIANIPDRDGQFLRNLLTDRLYKDGTPDSAPYLLTFGKLETTIQNIGIRRDATSTRGLMQVTGHMTLTDKATGKVLLEKEYRSVGAYNQLDNQFATLISKDNLNDHVIEEIADNIVTDLGLYFRRANTDTK